MVRMTNGSPFLSRVLAALLLVPLSLSTLQCAAAADGDSGSPPACCARDNSSGDTLDPGPDTGLAGDSAPCSGICSGTALPLHVTVSANVGAVLPLGPPDDWLAGCSHAPDPFPPKLLYTA
jgi:hypothetical protein